MIALLLLGFGGLEYLNTRKERVAAAAAKARKDSLEAIRVDLVTALSGLPKDSLERSLHNLGQACFRDAITEWRVSFYRASRTAGWSRIAVAGNASGELGGYPSIPNGKGFSKYIKVFPDRVSGVTAISPFSYVRTEGRFAGIGDEAASVEFHASLSLDDLPPPMGPMRPDFYLLIYAAPRDELDACLALLIEADRGGSGVDGPDELDAKRLVSLGLMDALADLDELGRGIDLSKTALDRALNKLNEIYGN